MSQKVMSQKVMSQEFENENWQNVKEKDTWARNKRMLFPMLIKRIFESVSPNQPYYACITLRLPFDRPDLSMVSAR